MNILFYVSHLTWKSQFSRCKQHPKIVYTHLAVCTSGILNLFCSRPLTCHWTFAFSAVLITANFDWQPHKRGGRDPRWGESGVMCFCAPEPAKNGIGKQNKLNGKIRAHVCQGTTLLALCVCAPYSGKMGNQKCEKRKSPMRIYQQVSVRPFHGIKFCN